MALYECRYQWPEIPGRTQQQKTEAFRRVFTAAEAQPDHVANVRGWYQYPGAQNGFLVIEIESAEALHAFLAPYVELMSWDIRPLMAHDFGQRREQALAAATA